MKKKEHTIKKLFSKEKVGNKVGKKVPRPWIMQYHWNSYTKFKDHSFFSTYKEGWQPGFDKYTDVEHGLQMLNKDIRSYCGDRSYIGRTFRLFNKETKKIQELIVVGKEIKLLV